MNGILADGRGAAREDTVTTTAKATAATTVVRVPCGGRDQWQRAVEVAREFDRRCITVDPIAAESEQRATEERPGGGGDGGQRERREVRVVECSL